MGSPFVLWKTRVLDTFEDAVDTGDCENNLPPGSNIGMDIVPESSPDWACDKMAEDLRCVLQGDQEFADENSSRE